jgi:hypothetical protein
VNGMLDGFRHRFFAFQDGHFSVHKRSGISGSSLSWTLPRGSSSAFLLDQASTGQAGENHQGYAQQNGEEDTMSFEEQPN